MTLQECLTKLAYGELSNLWGTSTISGEIPEDKKPLVINAINEALLRLYSRFALKENAVYVELNEHTTRYELSTKHLIDDPNESGDDSIEECDKYLWDTPEYPFTDNIIKILDVYTTDGFRVKLNNPTSIISVYTPSFNILQVPYPKKGVVLSVSYQAKHAELSLDNLDQEIELPESLWGALTAYVAYLIHSNINTEVAIANAQKYLSIYTSIIDDVVTTDSINVTYSANNVKFFNRGWC